MQPAAIEIAKHTLLAGGLILAIGTLTGFVAQKIKVPDVALFTIVVIATVGVVITAAITGLAAYYVLGVPMIVALLMGAALASTDPATLVPIFRQVQIR